MKIVVIEDEIRIREGLSHILSSLNADYEVIGTAADGLEGLKLIQQTSPDLIITDIRMPQMDGIEMLHQLRAEHNHAEIIFLTAYSDFSYAKDALRLQAADYLLKPIDMDEMARAMEKAAAAVRQKQLQGDYDVASLEPLLSRLITAPPPHPERQSSRLMERLQLPADRPVLLYLFYLGNAFSARRLQFRIDARQFLSSQPQRAFLFEVSEKQCFAFLFSASDDTVSQCALLQSQILQRKDALLADASCGYIVLPSILSLRDQFQKLYAVMDWNIADPKTAVFSYDAIAATEFSKIVLPTPENQIKAAVCAYDREAITSLFRRFFEALQGAPLCHPKDIKEVFIRLLWDVMVTAKEIGWGTVQEISQKELLQAIVQAKSQQELSELLASVLSKMDASLCNAPAHLSLLVKRTINLVQQKYGDGITLDEIASMLHVTPEYLGTQFHHEMQITFGAYIKKFRIEQAKKLLISSSDGLSSIAAQVGYADPKYFSKVFRSLTGQAPTEYRVTHT